MHTARSAADSCHPSQGSRTLSQRRRRVLLQKQQPLLVLPDANAKTIAAATAAAAAEAPQIARQGACPLGRRRRVELEQVQACSAPLHLVALGASVVAYLCTKARECLRERMVEVRGLDVRCARSKREGGQILSIPCFFQDFWEDVEGCRSADLCLGLAD